MKKRFLTGMRPTNRLTIGNYLGGIKPLLDMQKLNEEIYLFVATLHGLTDNEPSDVQDNVLNIVGDYIAAGVSPEKVCIYNQYDIRFEVSLMAHYLSREVTTARLIRLPTLKDKMRDKNIEQANAALLLYPVLMATDIVCQDATHVPVGRDQKPHLEITREIVRSINGKYGESVLISPSDYDEPGESVNILSLRGSGKMSKSNPEGALFLYDSKEELVKKIKRAETGIAGTASPQIESMLLVANNVFELEVVSELDDLYKQHKAGSNVMGAFKDLFTKSIFVFFESFQDRRSEIDRDQIHSILNEGAITARKNALEVLGRMEVGMGF